MVMQPFQMYWADRNSRKATFQSGKKTTAKDSFGVFIIVSSAYVSFSKTSIKARSATGFCVEIREHKLTRERDTGASTPCTQIQSRRDWPASCRTSSPVHCEWPATRCALTPSRSSWSTFGATTCTFSSTLKEVFASLVLSLVPLRFDRSIRFVQTRELAPRQVLTDSMYDDIGHSVRRDTYQDTMKTSPLVAVTNGTRSQDGMDHSQHCFRFPRRSTHEKRKGK